MTLHGLPAGDCAGEWFRVSNGAVETLAGFHYGGGDMTFTPSWTDAAVLWLRRNDRYLCKWRAASSVVGPVR